MGRLQQRRSRERHGPSLPKKGTGTQEAIQSLFFPASLTETPMPEPEAPAGRASSRRR